MTLSTLKHYEYVFIYNSNEATYTQSKKRVEAIFKENEITIIEETDMGVQALSHDIKGHKNGHYYAYEVKALPSQMQALSKELYLQEDLLRFISVHLDKYAMAFREKRKQEREKALQEAASSIDSEATTKEVPT